MKTVKIKVERNGKSFVVGKDEYANFSQNYHRMFDRLMIDLADDDRLDYIIFGYDERLKGNTIMAFTPRCTLFRTDAVFSSDHANDDDVVANFLNDWLKLPAVESDKEQFEGIFAETGKKIKFNRMWNNYRFSDSQCKQLLNGEHIFFESAGKDGNDKRYIGKLAEQEYSGFRYFGFKLDGWALPKDFLGHTLTNTEIEKLLKGEEVLMYDLTSKKTGKTFSAFTKYTISEGLRITKF